MKALRVIILALVAVLSVSGVAVAKKPQNNNGNGHTPVTICHHAGPNPANWHTITVDDDSVTLNAHLGHGDTLGPCPAVVVTPPDEPPVDNPPVDNPEEPTTPPETPTEPQVDTPQENGVTKSPKKVSKPAPKKNKDNDVAAVAPPSNNDGGPTALTPAQKAQTATNTGQLPYTGLDWWLLLTVGVILVGSGYALKRYSFKPTTN